MARKSFLLRADPHLWAELEAWAAAEFRSVNGQVEYLLREAVARRRRSRNPEQGSAEDARAVPQSRPEKGGSQLGIEQMGEHG